MSNYNKAPTTPKRPRFHPFFKPGASSPSKNSLFPLSPSSIDRIQLTLSHGWAPTTLDSYARTFEKFSHFCKTERIPIESCFPADEHLLCAFAASLAGRMAHSTVRNHLSALKAWHHAHGYDWKGGHLLQCVMRGVKRMVPDSSIRPPRPPITYEMLQLLRSDLNQHNHLHACVWACALTAFWGRCRLGELLPASLPIDTSIFPKLKHLTFPADSSKLPTLFLPSTKTHQRTGETVTLTSHSRSLSPSKAIRRHIEINDIDMDVPLFLFRSGSILKYLTKPLFLAVCNSVWSKHSYPPMSGHSFRIGGTSEMLIKGVNPDVVKVTGRWKSDSFIRYWRFGADIAAANILTIHK